MKSTEYIRVRGLQKLAVAAGGGALTTIGSNVLGALKSVLGFAAGTTKNVAGEAVKGSTAATKVAVPTLGLITAWLAYKATSPQAVAKMAPEFATHAIERESLLQSMRDLERAEMDARIKKNKRRVHDQFL